MVRRNVSSEIVVSLRRRARVLTDRCDLAGAAALLEQSLTLSPGPEVAQDLALVCVELDRGEQAKNLLLDLLARNRENVRALVILAFAYRRCDKDLSTCETMLRSAFAIAPQDSRVLSGLGGWASTSGQYEAAFGWFALAIEADPEYPNPRHGLALAHTRSERWKRSNAVLESMFEHARMQDVTSGIVFQQAFDLRRLNRLFLKIEEGRKSRRE